MSRFADGCPVSPTPSTPRCWRSRSTSTTPLIRCTATGICRCSMPTTTPAASCLSTSTTWRAAHRWRCSRARARRRRGPRSAPVSAGVKLPNYAKPKFPSLWMVAGHYDLLNFTTLRMLSVGFQSAEVAKVITWERLFMLHELHAQGASISAIAR